MKLHISSLNKMRKVQFIMALDGVFEYSNWIAERAFKDIPFNDTKSLCLAMEVQVYGASIKEIMQLLCAHPQLAGKKMQGDNLSINSTKEQVNAKLDALNSIQMAKISSLNKKYLQKFGFPFIIAVSEHSRDNIFSQFELRLHNDIVAEQNNALAQVIKIARLRLNLLFD